MKHIHTRKAQHGVVTIALLFGALLMTNCGLLVGNGTYSVGEITPLPTDATSFTDAGMDAGITAVDAGPCSMDGATARPLDQLPKPRAAFGLRLLNSQYSQALINLSRSGGGTMLVYPTDAGAFPTETVMAWADGGTVTVATWYDQSGYGNNIGPGTGVAPPTLVFNAYQTFVAVGFSAPLKQALVSNNLTWVSGNSSWSMNTTMLGGFETIETAGTYQDILGYGNPSTGTSMYLLAQADGYSNYSLSVYGSDLVSQVQIPLTPVASYSVMYSSANQGPGQVTGYVNRIALQFSGNPLSFGPNTITGTGFSLGGSVQQGGFYFNGMLGDLILFPYALTSTQAIQLGLMEACYYGYSY